MNVELTVKQGAELDEIRDLIIALRAHLRDGLVIFEVPATFESPLPLPLLTVEEGENEERMYGQMAVERLKDMMKQAA